MTIGKMTTFEEQCEMPCEENKSNEKCSALNFYVEIETADANDDINTDDSGGRIKKIVLLILCFCTFLEN